MRHGGVEYALLIIDSESQKAGWFSRSEAVKRTGGQVVGCEKLNAVSHARTGPGYLRLTYGGVCTVERGGRKIRALVCEDREKSDFRERAVEDGPVSDKDIEIFTIENCSP
jgi:hypothetical protein